MLAASAAPPAGWHAHNPHPAMDRLRLAKRQFTTLNFPSDGACSSRTTSTAAAGTVVPPLTSSWGNRASPSPPPLLFHHSPNITALSSIQRPQAKSSDENSVVSWTPIPPSVHLGSTSHATILRLGTPPLPQHGSSSEQSNYMHEAHLHAEKAHELRTCPDSLSPKDEAYPMPTSAAAAFEARKRYPATQLEENCQLEQEYVERRAAAVAEATRFIAHMARASTGLALQRRINTLRTQMYGDNSHAFTEWRMASPSRVIFGEKFSDALHTHTRTSSETQRALALIKSQFINDNVAKPYYPPKPTKTVAEESHTHLDTREETTEGFTLLHASAQDSTRIYYPPSALETTVHSTSSPPNAVVAQGELAALQESKRALELIATVRALRSQTEELTMTLLHTAGEWGCWENSSKKSPLRGFFLPPHQAAVVVREETVADINLREMAMRISPSTTTVRGFAPTTSGNATSISIPAPTSNTVSIVEDEKRQLAVQILQQEPFRRILPPPPPMDVQLEIHHLHNNRMQQMKKQQQQEEEGRKKHEQKQDPQSQHQQREEEHHQQREDNAKQEYTKKEKFSNEGPPKKELQNIFRSTAQDENHSSSTAAVAPVESSAHKYDHTTVPEWRQPMRELLLPSREHSNPSMIDSTGDVVALRKRGSMELGSLPTRAEQDAHLQIVLAKSAREHAKLPPSAVQASTPNPSPLSLLRQSSKRNEKKTEETDRLKVSETSPVRRSSTTHSSYSSYSTYSSYSATPRSDENAGLDRDAEKVESKVSPLVIVTQICERQQAKTTTTTTTASNTAESVDTPLHPIFHAEEVCNPILSLDKKKKKGVKGLARRTTSFFARMLMCGRQPSITENNRPKGPK